MHTLINKQIVVLLLGLSLNVDILAQRKTDTLHDDFDRVLMAHVKGGYVDYAGIKNDPRFSRYVHTLKTAKPDQLASEQERLAFWINAYNALAIKGIIEGLSPGSFFGRVRYFKTTHYELAGRRISLYDLEREIIIPFNEPRIHFAIVCASRSCPKLASAAYVASKLEQQLEDNARAFINNPAKNELLSNQKTIKVSKIFDWFKDDFAKHAGSVQKYIAQYVDDPALAQALSKEAFKVKYRKYDWGLNGNPPD